MMEGSGSGLAGTALTTEALETAARAAFPALPALRLPAVTAELIGVGKGFVSNIIKASATWSGADDGVPTRFVLKVPVTHKMTELMDDMMADATDEQKAAFGADQMAETVPIMHETECRVYEFFKSDPSHTIPIPKMYWTQRVSEKAVGLLMMEDLSDDMSLPSLQKGFDQNQLEQLFDALADISAFSIRHKEGIAEFPNPMEEMMENFMPMITASFDAAIKTNPEYFEGKLEGLKDKFSAPGALKQMEEECVERWKQPRVLVHGDMHGFNVIFTKDGRRLRALVDWQTAHPGLATEDMGRLLSFTATAALRRRVTGDLLRRFHARLARLVRPDPVPFTLGELSGAFAEGWAFQVAGLVMICSSMLKDESPLVADLTPGEKGDLREEMLCRARDALQDAEDPKSWIPID